jgi:transposase InsO family protein
MGKACFEQWLWDQCVSKVIHYHGDNGIFSAEEYHCDCEEKGQSQSFSGVGAQHQNARAERAIQTIANLVPPDLTPNITPAPEGAHRRTRGNAFSMDLQLQLCSKCSVRTYSFGISYQGTV